MRKVEVNKAVTRVRHQEHNAGCVYVFIKAFRRPLTSFSDIVATIDYLLKNS